MNNEFIISSNNTAEIITDSSLIQPSSNNLTGVINVVNTNQLHTQEQELKEFCNCLSIEFIHSIYTDIDDFIKLRHLYWMYIPLLSKNIYAFAIRDNKLEYLEVLIYDNFPSEYMIIANHTELDCIKYAVEHGCPIGILSLFDSNKLNKVDIVQYFIDIDIIEYEPACRDFITLKDAALTGNISLLKYLYSKGYSWSVDVSHTAAKYGHLDCLIYAHQNGCPLSVDCLLESYEYNNKECFRYLIMNGCPLSNDIINICCSSNSLDYFEDFKLCYQYWSSPQDFWNTTIYGCLEPFCKIKLEEPFWNDLFFIDLSNNRCMQRKVNIYLELSIQLVKRFFKAKTKKKSYNRFDTLLFDNYLIIRKIRKNRISKDLNSNVHVPDDVVNIINQYIM